MYCRQCGHKLFVGDKFCSSCGAEVQKNVSSIKFFYKLMDYSIVKIFLYLVFLTVIISMIYSILLPSHISLSEFISDPGGLWTILWEQVGRGLGNFIFFLPILLGLAKSGGLSKSHKLNGFFVLTLVDTLTSSIFGEKRVSNLNYVLYSHGIEFITSALLIIIYDKIIYKNKS